MSLDAVIVGSGPNGLAAAIRLAQAHLSVRVIEANDTVGGGCRSAQLTGPGFIHDVCSAIHPLAAASPFFSALPLADHGLEFIQPQAPLAHPFDDGTVAMVERSLGETTLGLGADGVAWRRVVGTVARDWDRLRDVRTGPLAFPNDPLAFARFGALALLPAATLIRASFKERAARALFAGCAAHSFLSLEAPFSSAFGLVLAGSAHAVGWPIARGGSQRIADALASYLRSLGGEIVTGTRVRSLSELPPARAYLFDTSPRAFAQIAAQRLPAAYRESLQRYRHGPGVFKVDYALDGPVPWRAHDCLRAGTVHVGGTFEEIAESEREVARGRIPERPFVLVAQQSLFDPGRAPVGRQTLWAYCHVPNGSTVDMRERITSQIERFAPGFRDRILGQHTQDSGAVERENANYVGGDISCGAYDGLQLLARPMARLDPYSTPARDLYLCSAATPPGAGVHGMCGFHGAGAALHRAFA